MHTLILSFSFLFLILLGDVAYSKIIIFKDCRGSTQKEFDKKSYKEFKWTLDTEKKEASLLVVYTDDFIKNSSNSKTHYDKYPIIFADDKYIIAGEKKDIITFKLTFFLNLKEVEHSTKFENDDQEIVNKSFCK